jgi:diguanylate cyclase (GGDEF)-like protein
LSIRSKLWIGATAGLCVAQGVLSAWLPRGYALTASGDILCALLMLAPLLAFAGNAIPSQGRLRAFWILQAAAWLLWLADQSLWIAYDIFLHQPMPEVFAGDVLLFVAGVPMLAGLLLRPHLQPSARSARLGVLDFLLLMFWWVYLYVYFVECWHYVSKSDALYNQNFDRLYVVEIVVLTIVMGMLWRRSTGAWRRFYAKFLGAVLFNSVVFLVENFAVEQNKYYVGSWYDTPYLASFVVLMAVAISGRALTPSPETREDEERGSWMRSLAMVAVLSLPAVAVTTLFDGSVPAQIVRFRVIVTAVTMFVMAAIVFTKQHRLHEELQHSNHELEEVSMTDPLTGIRNRRFFSATIEGDIAQTVRAHVEGHDRSTRDLIFYLIDVDNFKEVNDLYGHDAGDRVLVEMSRRISSAIRNSDLLVRWGGEEFLVVSRYTNRGEANILALRVMEAIRGRPFVVSTDNEMRRTCSIGWAAFPWLEENAGAMRYEEVLKLADRGLCQAKAAGKDQTIGMTPLREETFEASAMGQ